MLPSFEERIKMNPQSPYLALLPLERMMVRHTGVPFGIEHCDSDKIFTQIPNYL